MEDRYDPISRLPPEKEPWSRRRKNQPTELDRIWQPAHITQNAPFGTSLTPTLKVKIVGGKTIPTYDSQPFQYGSPRVYDNATTRNGRAGSRASRASPGPSTPRKLEPLTEKPNAFDPTPFKQSQGYTSAQKDTFRSHIHGSDLNSSAPLSPHRPLPPISADHEEELGSPAGYTDPMLNGERDILDILPKDTYLPRRSLQLTTEQDKELKIRIAQDLQGFDLAKLKDVYLELTGYDHALSGHLTFTELASVMLRHQVRISLEHLRLVASQYLTAESKVNYEKVISYINVACRDAESGVFDQREHLQLLEEQRRKQQQELIDQQQRQLEELKQKYKEQEQTLQQQRDDQEEQARQKRQQQQQETSILYHQPPSPTSPRPPPAITFSPKSTPRTGYYYNPLTHEATGSKFPINSPAETSRPKFPFGGTKDNAKLLRMIEEQLVNSGGEDLEMDRVWDVFRVADRDRRGTLSRDQIKILTMASRIPLQENLIDQIIDRCERYNEQYSWEDYLNFIGRVLPQHTGLILPRSRQPKDFWKQPMKPSPNWPNKTAVPEHTNAAVTLVPEDTNPDTNPGSDPQYSHQSQLDDMSRKLERQKLIENMEQEIQKLENTYQETKRKLASEGGDYQTKRLTEDEPWTQRLLHLGKALYKQDIDGKGTISRKECEWEIGKYNDVFNLGMAENEIKGAINTSTNSSGLVNIETVLRKLGALGVAHGAK